MKIRLFLIFISILPLGNVIAQNNTNDKYVVIANNEIVNDSIDISFVKKVYGGRIVLWSNQVKIEPCYIGSHSSDGIYFFHNILKMPEKKFNKYWTKKVFSGNGAKPVMFKNVDDAIKYVLENNGGITIIPHKKVVNKKYKVLMILDNNSNSVSIVN